MLARGIKKRENIKIIETQYSDDKILHLKISSKYNVNILLI